MKSDVIMIDNQGNGFENTIEEARKVAAYEALSHKDSLHLQLCAEEMLSLVRSVTGEMKASFWIECEDGSYDLHLNTKTDLNKEQRYHLLATSTSGRNEAANTLRGVLWDRLEQALASDVDHDYDELPAELLADLPIGPVKDPEWDGYERRILKNVADNVKIGILHGVMDMVVSKKYT